MVSGRGPGAGGNRGGAVRMGAGRTEGQNLEADVVIEVHAAQRDQPDRSERVAKREHALRHLTLSLLPRRQAEGRASLRPLGARCERFGVRSRAIDVVARSLFKD